MSEKLIISVNEGKIQGFKTTSSFSGVEFYSFLGVPYGQSTAGYARFKDPVPAKPWKNVLNATTEKGGCFQFSLSKKQIDGTEDCLYNNIHTPKVPKKSGNDALKAVIAYIHPGAYIHGSPDPGYFGSPDYVMHNDIVYVCISFRLHILGFLNLELDECSGNQGLKDILLSLQWIQKNIKYFGGDPNNVTLLGSSSGAGLTHNLMISPAAKGLFHKGVIMGMYNYCPSTVVPEKNYTLAYELAQGLGFAGPCDKKKLLMFYKKLNMRKVLFARPERALIKGDYAQMYPVCPFVTTTDRGENAVLPIPDKQKNLKSMMRIPLMIGFCQREAAMGFLQPFQKTVTDNFYKSIRQNSFGWGRKLTDSQLQIIQKRVESYYLNGKSTELAPLTVKCDIQSDIALSDLYSSLIDVVAKDLPESVFVYKFEFEGNVPKMKDLFQFTFDEPLPGTMHGDDITYWTRFKDPHIKLECDLTPKTIETVNTFTKLISTFAKTGNPNYEELATQWKPTTVEKPCYLSINDDLQMVEGKLNGESMEFWKNIIEEFENNSQTSP